MMIRLVLVIALVFLSLNIYSKDIDSSKIKVVFAGELKKSDHFSIITNNEVITFDCVSENVIIEREIHLNRIYKEEDFGFCFKEIYFQNIRRYKRIMPYFSFVDTLGKSKLFVNYINYGNVNIDLQDENSYDTILKYSTYKFLFKPYNTWCRGYIFKKSLRKIEKKRIKLRKQYSIFRDSVTMCNDSFNITNIDTSLVLYIQKIDFDKRAYIASISWISKVEYAAILSAYTSKKSKNKYIKIYKKE